MGMTIFFGSAGEHSELDTRCAMKKAAVPSILVGVVLLALGVTAEAQQPKKVPRIGYLSIAV
jgi:hypothetical protein